MRRKRGFRVSGMVVIAGLAAVLARGAAAETLEEALAKAYMTNPQLLAEQAALRATDEDVPQALAGWRPTVTLSGEAGTEHIDSETSRQDRQPTLAEVEVTQPLYRGGRTTEEVARAESEVLAGRAQLHTIEQTVLLAAVGAYMNVVRDLAVLELNRNNEVRLRRQLQAAQDRFRVGEITRTDVAQAEARLSGATAARIQAEGALVSSRAAYRAVIGDTPGTLSRPTLAVTLPAVETEAQTRAEATSPEVVRASFLVESARHSVGVVRGELLPTLQLRGSLTTERETTGPDSHRDTAGLFAELSIPLYQGGGVYSRLRAAKETLGQRLEELDDSRRAAIERATSAWNNLETARAAVESFRAEVRANEIALDGVQREALVGSRTVLDVLDAEQELLDSRVNLVRSERDEVVARFELKAAVGELTARDLGLAVELYDSERNYREVRDKWFGAEKPAR
ncbi:MAG TPA: TolC family outer membrane protein [Alphaproteobacteria bacterium]